MRLENYSGPVWAGTSRLEVIGDTPTLTKFYDLVNKTAHERLDPAQPAEDQPSLEHRKVAALGDIADGAGARSKTKLYVHLSPDDQLGFVERFGPLTAATIREWLRASRFTLQPVLDMCRTDAVDDYEPPEWMRELVILRDRTCVHPNCAKTRASPRPPRQTPTTGPDPARQPGAAVQATPSGKDSLRLVLPAQCGRQLHLGRPVRTHVRRRYFTLTTSITNHSVELPGMLSPLPSAP